MRSSQVIGAAMVLGGVFLLVLLSALIISIILLILGLIAIFVGVFLIVAGAALLSGRRWMRWGPSAPTST